MKMKKKYFLTRSHQLSLKLVELQNPNADWTVDLLAGTDVRANLEDLVVKFDLNVVALNAIRRHERKNLLTGVREAVTTFDLEVDQRYFGNVG